MSMVKPLPVTPKTAAMDERAEKAYMKTFRHAERCEGCYRPNDGTIVGAHFNDLMNGVGWRRKGAIMALCHDCHNIVDRRQGDEEARRLILARVLGDLLEQRGREWKELKLDKPPAGRKRK